MLFRSTAFEEAPADERKDMLQDLARQTRSRSREGQIKGGLEEPKKRRRTRKRKPAVVSSLEAPQASSDATESPVVKSEPPQVNSGETPEKPAVEKKHETPRSIPSQEKLQAEQRKNSYTEAAERPARRKPKAKSVLLTTPKKQ